MKRLQTIFAVLVAALLCIPPIQAQRETEILVVEYVLDQVGAVTASAEIRNAGQTQHSMFVRLENKPAQVCTDAGLNVQFEQGIAFQDDPDTVTWSLLGLPVTATEYGAVNSVYRSNTSGAIRNIRINATAFDTVRCLVSVTYVGSTRPVPLYDIGGDTNVVFASYYFFNPVAADPPCNAGEYFLFYNVTDGVLRLCANGVISDVSGGSPSGDDTKITLRMTDAIVLDGTTDNNTALMARGKAAAVGTDAFWLEGVFADGQRLMWTFDVPANYASAPILTMSVVSSTSIGAFDFSAALRCVTPDNTESWSAAAFDVDNDIVGEAFSAGALETITIPLTNDDDMTAGDTCTLVFRQESAGIQLETIAGVINYTGS